MKYIKPLILIVLLFIISCNQTTLPLVSYPGRDSDSKNEISKLIESERLIEAKNLAYEKVKDNPNDEDYYKLLAISLFKLAEYEPAEQILDAYFEHTDAYDSVHVKPNFDLYYYYVYSLIELEKFDKANDVLYKKLDKNKLTDVDRVKAELLEIRLDYRKGEHKHLTQKITQVIIKYNLNDEIKLNLFYILAVVNYKIDSIATCIELINSMIELDSKGEYQKKVNNLISAILVNADSKFLEKYNDQLIYTIEKLLVKTDDKALRVKLLRNLYSMKNTTLSIQTDTRIENRSALTVIKLALDKASSKVMFGSNEGFDYSHEYDGKSLKIRIKDKELLTETRRMEPYEASGIRSFNWDKDGEDIVFTLEFTGNYDMNFEELHDDFEKNAYSPDRHQLILNIALPEEPQPEIFDQDEKRYTIVLDPGHGGDDFGALSIKRKPDGTRYSEKEMNLIICKELKEYLEDKGYRVFLTRDRDYYPSLIERNRIAQNRNADMFLSIHMNSGPRRYRNQYQTDRFMGLELVVRKSLGKQPDFVNFEEISKKEWLSLRRKALSEHKKLSRIFEDTIPSSLDRPYNKKRKTKYKNLAIFSGMTIPHALIEIGFIINNENLEYYLDKKGQKSLFEGIYKGIKKYQEKTNWSLNDE